MTVYLAVLQHESCTGLGRFAELLEDSGADYEIFQTRGRLPDPLAFDGALCLGGSLATYDPNLFAVRRWIRDAVVAGVPYLGVCLGGQLLASALGARVRHVGAEAGVHSVLLTDAAEHDPLFSGLPRRLEVFGWHGDSFDLPRGAVPLGRSAACAYQAFRYARAAYALQFHAELRPEDVTRWRDVPGYNRLLHDSEREWEDVVLQLARATPALDSLAAQLLVRWLELIADIAALRERAAGVGIGVQTASGTARGERGKWGASPIAAR